MKHLTMKVHSSFKESGFPKEVPMQIFNEEWAQRNHGQSLDYLNERGGLSPNEMLAIIEKRPWKKINEVEAMLKIINNYVLRPIEIRKNEREFILCSAFHYDDGEQYKEQAVNIISGFIVCGRRHSDCYNIFELMCRCKDFDINKFTKDKLGFITSTNRFVGRKEGYIIAKRENQLVHDIHDTTNLILTSECLYFSP